MRAFPASAVAVAAILTATDLQAADLTAPSPKVSAQSEEGQAIIKRAREITGRLRFLNRPVVYPMAPVVYPTLDPDRTKGWLAPARVRPEPIGIASGLRGKLAAERAELLSRLDLDSLEALSLGLR